ncbi:MAG: hypothetical protein Q4P25_00140 [Tissierellia bacterium]|nr:hypothetical protein [Tissierellia bacterium]
MKINSRKHLTQLREKYYPKILLRIQGNLHEEELLDVIVFHKETISYEEKQAVLLKIRKKILESKLFRVRILSTSEELHSNYKILIKGNTYKEFEFDRIEDDELMTILNHIHILGDINEK